MVRVVRLERTVSWSQTRRDTNFAIPGYSVSAMIPRRGVKIKFFLSVVIYVVKGDFVPLSATDGNPANAGIARLCGVSPHPIPDTTTALPNLSGKLFMLVYSGFQCFLICFTYSLTLLSPLCPHVPAPSVVIAELPAAIPAGGGECGAGAGATAPG